MHALNLACAVFLVSMSSQLQAETEQHTIERIDSRKPVESPRKLFSKTCESGMLFFEDQFIEAPYHISCTNDSITLNGVVYTIPAPASRIDSELSGKRFRRFPGDQRQFFPAANFARQFARVLEDDAVVILFPPEEGLPFKNQFALLQQPSTRYALYASLLKHRTYESRVDFEVSEEQWERMQPLLNSVVLPNALLERMQQFVDKMDEQEAEFVERHAAVARLDTFAYPLTIVAMILGVFAFGHMLKWAGTTLANAETNSPQAIRYVEVGLLLMLALSSIDLIWTLLAVQAGAMEEVNPIAAQFINSPLQLTIFKLVATGIGCGILYAYRHRAQMQQATWWLCLVTVLLTFRWLVFDSMMHT